MARRVTDTGRKARRVRTVSRTARKIAHGAVAAGLDVPAVVRVHTTQHEPLNLHGLQLQLRTALRSQGGRPGLVGAQRRQKIPMANADWKQLEALAGKLRADGLATTPGQVAAKLLHDAIAAVGRGDAPQPRPYGGTDDSGSSPSQLRETSATYEAQHSRSPRTMQRDLAMGVFDTIVLLDDSLVASCAAGHAVRSLQTKDLDQPFMETYLVHGGRLYVTSSSSKEEAREAWRIEGGSAVREHRFTLSPVTTVRAVRAYASCGTCEPVLVRTNAAAHVLGLVQEHDVCVDFMLTFRPGKPLQIERTTGTRDDMKADLRGRGLYVLEDHEPLAVAHREVRKAEQTLRSRGRF
jgi:hypothetical protein